MTWNLTVAESQTEPVDYRLHTLAALGLLLCFIPAAVCLCRKCRTRISHHDPVQTQSQSDGQLGPQNIFTVQDVPAEPRGSVDEGRNVKQRREYMEKLNSLYGHI
uniref:Uncharacterized protein n=1 Tax=Iconisemion striatum TaxID=60296 RepID=A0A1A7WIV1_9TELE